MNQLRKSFNGTDLHRKLAGACMKASESSEKERDISRFRDNTLTKEKVAAPGRGRRKRLFIFSDLQQPHDVADEEEDSNSYGHEQSCCLVREGFNKR